MYSSIASLYDKLYHFIDYPGLATRVTGMIKDRSPHAKSLLEVACGTGLYLEELSQHFEVEGLDLEQEMLDICHTRLPGAPLHAADMCDFNLGRTYDVVCCLFRSIACARTRELMEQSINCMAKHLAPGGILLVEPFFTPETYWADRVTLNRYESPELKIAWMYTSERHGNVARQENHYLVGDPSGPVRHLTETHELGLHSPEDFASAFAAAGLDMEYDSEGPGGVGMYFGRRA